MHRQYPWETCGCSKEHETIAVDEHVLAEGDGCGCKLPHRVAGPGEPVPAYDEECEDCD